MAKLVLSRRGGLADVTMESDLQRKFRRALKRALPKTLEVIEGALEKTYQEAHARWPEKTGLSKRSLDYEVRFVPPDRVEGVLFNHAEKDGYQYAYAIRAHAITKRGTVWNHLVLKPGIKRAEQLAPELAEELAGVINDA